LQDCVQSNPPFKRDLRNLAKACKTSDTPAGALKPQKA
jgi:hypothetical protein